MSISGAPGDWLTATETPDVNSRGSPGGGGARGGAAISFLPLPGPPLLTGDSPPRYRDLLYPA